MGEQTTLKTNETVHCLFSFFSVQKKKSPVASWRLLIDYCESPDQLNPVIFILTQNCIFFLNDIM